MTDRQETTIGNTKVVIDFSRSCKVEDVEKALREIARRAQVSLSAAVSEKCYGSAETADGVHSLRHFHSDILHRVCVLHRGRA